MSLLIPIARRETEWTCAASLSKDKAHTVEKEKEKKKTPLPRLTVSASVPALETFFLGLVSGRASSTASSRSPEPLPDKALTGIGSTPDCHASAMAAAARAELSHCFFGFVVVQSGERERDGE